MVNPAQPLIDLKKETDFLVCVDSDGCVYDTMEVKHKECFTPNTINYWDLQAVSKYAREAADFVNLYSVNRGINRFPALIMVLELTAERPEVIERGFKGKDITSLKKWLEQEKVPGNPALEAYIKNNPGDEVLQRTLDWSHAVNKTVEDLVRDVPPFPYLRESFEKLQGKAEVIVVSQTPNEAIEREWTEHDIAKYVKVIAGQELGTKKDCIKYAKENRYADDHTLMVGDAMGDYNAAKGNNALFYPINPGNEVASWKRFYEEAIDKFLNGTYKGEYQDSLIKEFESYLPVTPPWKK